MAAIQIANLAGAVPIAVTRTSAKKQQLLEAGAKFVIVAEEVDLGEEFMRITEDKGARVAFDPIGGPNLPKLISALAEQGVVYLYGALAEGPTTIPVLEMISKLPTIKGYSLWTITGDEKRRPLAVHYIVKGLATGALKAVIDRTSSAEALTILSPLRS